MTYTALQVMELIAFGLMVCTPLALNSYAAKGERFARYADAMCMAVVLCLVWILTNCLQILVGPPESKALNPLIDLIAGAIAMRSYIQRPRVWKGLFVSLLLIQVLLSSTFWLAWIGRHLTLQDAVGTFIYGRYEWLNLALWIPQLVVVAWPGGRYVARRLGARLHRGRGVAPDLGARPG